MSHVEVFAQETSWRGVKCRGTNCKNHKNSDDGDNYRKPEVMSSSDVTNKNIIIITLAVVAIITTGANYYCCCCHHSSPPPS